MSTARENYIATYNSGYTAWASGAQNADKQEPASSSVTSGWSIEQPSHSTMNWWQNRTDRRLDVLEANVAWLESLGQ